MFTVEKDFSLSLTKTLVGHKEQVTCAAFSMKEKNILVSGSQDRSGMPQYLLLHAILAFLSLKRGFGIWSLAPASIH